MNIDEEFNWKDLSTEGYPKEGQKIIVDVRMIRTGEVVYDNNLPPKAKFVFDAEHILKDTRFAYVSKKQMQKIEKEYW